MTIVLILVVAVLVMLFAVGVGVGFEERGLPAQRDLERWADEWLGAPVGIGSSDVDWGDDAGRWNRRTIPAEGQRSLRVVASKRGQRELTLVTRDALRIELRRAIAPDVPVAMTTKAGEESELSQRIDGEGAEVLLQCQQVDPCEVELR